MHSRGGQQVSITTNEASRELERLQEEVLYGAAIRTSYFRTSQHQTFAQKIASPGLVNDWHLYIQTGVQDIGRTVAGQELFDAFEIAGVEKTGGKAGDMRPLVRFHADENTAWCQEINQLVYHNAAPRNPALSIGWDNRPSHLGLPPMQAVSLDQVSEDVRLTDAMISSGVATGSSGKVAYVYQLPFYMFYDYYYLQQKAANSGLNTTGIRYLLDTPFRPIYPGQYPVMIGYYLPGESGPKSKQFFTITKP